MNYQNNTNTNIFSPQGNGEGWNFMDYSSNPPSEAPLQEPVAFEGILRLLL